MAAGWCGFLPPRDCRAEGLTPLLHPQTGLRAMSCRYASFLIACMMPGACVPATPQRDRDTASDVRTNDNRTAGGSLRGDVLRIDLMAARGQWYPERDEGPAHEVYVFGEQGKPLQNPGPMIRVPIGTEVRATIRNSIEGAPLTVHGLHDRPGRPRPLTIASGTVDSVRFRLSRPGTYHYWGTTRGASTLRDRWGMESQLLGAIIVDSAPPDTSERILVIGVEDDSGSTPGLRHLRAAVINGLSWPHSPPSDVRQGDTVRTRWLNLSDRVHPIHLHGFYFTVDRRGDIALDSAYDSASKRIAVTELLGQGQTMAVHWVAERPGNWLMHCHMTEHMSHELRSRPAAMDDAGHNHSMHAMSGLVVGWRVAPRAGADPAASPAGLAPHRVRLLVQTSPRRYGTHPAIGFVIDSGNGPVRRDSVVVPGPPLILSRGVPAEITVVNHLAEPTSIHWHGIELDSYFDGVSGWSGIEGSVAPHVAPGDSFVVRFTPPRAGTFIYHTHFAEEHQLSSGMYGALIVMEPGVRHDPATDKPLLFGQAGPGRALETDMLLNGERNPSFDLRVGERYRLRVVNINPNMPLGVSLVADSQPVRWRAIAKDGADLPARMATVRPARLRIGVGEAYDYEFIPERPGDLTLRAVDPEGKVKVSSVFRVR